MRRYIPSICAMSILLVAINASGLINPNVTPRDLIKISPAVVELQIGPRAKDGALPVKIVKAHKGAAPEALKLTMGTLPQAVEGFLLTAVPEDRAVTAVYFRSKLAGDDAEKDAPAGALLVGSHFYGLKTQAADEALQIVEDTRDLRTIWAGTAEMFVRLAEAAKADPQLVVPVKVEATWGQPKAWAKLDGPVHALLPVEWQENTRGLLALSSTGDRLYGLDKGEPIDVTTKVGWRGKSRFAVLGNFSGSGRLDAVTSDGKSLTLQAQAGDGTFSASSVDVKLPSDAKSLALIGSADGKTPAVLVGVKGAPLRITINPAVATPIAAVDEKTLATLGDGGGAVAVDFDGDGVTDVLQVFANGAALYRGTATGFAGPTVACRAKLSGDARIALGDFDADGLLDVLLTGDGGSALLRNLGNGKFIEQVQDSGEIGYDDKLEATAATTIDLNNDGRIDVALAFADKLPFLFFNRGFFTFGVANDMLFETEEAAVRKTAADLREGQQAITAADLAGDGHASLYVIAKNGQGWRLPCVPSGAKLTQLTLAASVTDAAPRAINVVAGKRNLGATLVQPGRPALIGVPVGAALTINQKPAAPASGPMRFVVGN